MSSYVATITPSMAPQGRGGAARARLRAARERREMRVAEIRFLSTCVMMRVAFFFGVA